MLVDMDRICVREFCDRMSIVSLIDNNENSRCNVGIPISIINYNGSID